MSFIPSRDVFGMSDEEKDFADNLYDEIEKQYLDDWAKDEYGQDWTWERVQNETNYHGWPTIGGYDMMIYMLNREKNA